MEIGLRYFFLSFHYSHTINFHEFETYKKAFLNLRKNYFRHCISMEENFSLDLEPLLNNLNTAIFIQKIHKEEKLKNWSLMKSMIHFLGFQMENLSRLAANEISEQILKREKYRKEKNWQESDKIRNYLYENFIEIDDSTGDWFYF